MDFRDFVKHNKPMEQKHMNEPLAARRVPPRKPAPVKPKPTNEAADIISESQNMIAVLQEKVEQVFYRFGMTGLEKLDECMIDTIQELMGGVPARTNESAPTAARRVPPKKPRIVKTAPTQSAKTKQDDMFAMVADALKSMGPVEGRAVAGAMANTAAPQPVVHSQPAPIITKVSENTVPQEPLTDEENSLLAQNSLVKKHNNFSMDDLAALGAALK